MSERQRCSQLVYTPGGSFRGHACSKPAKVTRDGKPYCTVHDPERVAKKHAEWSANLDAKWARERKERELADAVRLAAENVVKAASDGWDRMAEDLKDPNVDVTVLALDVLNGIGVAVKAHRKAKEEASRG